MALVGCGRLRFDPLGSGDADNGDGSNAAGHVAIATGDQFTCALARGSISCWGEGHYGQLGNGMTLTMATPQAGPAIANAVALDAGLQHACALDASGGMWCWGDNMFGDVGDATGIERTTPTLISSLGTVNAVAAGTDFTCAIDATGQTWCWGDNARGQIGIGTTSSALTPVDVTLP